MRVRNFVYWIRGDDFLPYLSLSVASVRRSNPDARVYVMAERVSRPIEGVIWWPIDYGTPLMLANLQAQCEFLISARRDRGATVFLDVDTLVLKPLVAMPNADLIVTYRDHVGVRDGEKVEGVAKLMPYNYGVVMAGDTLAAKEAFLWMRDRVSKYHVQLQSWYGNQRALAELAGGRPKEPCTRIRKVPYSDVVVAYLDSEQYNFTPESTDDDLSGKYIVHVKGNRKDMMQPIWEACMAA